MIEELAVVSAIGHDGVRVIAARNSACAQCASKSNCATGVLSEWREGKTVEIDVDNPDAILVSPGQQVMIGLEEGSLMRASLLLYLLPLALLILGALVGSGFAWPEWQQVLLSLGLMMIGFIMARRWSSGRMTGKRYQPVLLRTL
ncbi:SoxR reducing system RseC family protein [Marinobacterium weihaiense]|uniref:SoxR reducing system RseC family protein n=1 Tax=Marinobacterium weihaiense TaxID=2851016 RepID=A0ABS6MB60_9GAMM|nr:SoxR reducing system RseC family protein [Marinobacterium weihaiense]MBV0933547.1 SoxR reducing system RseC family protein [Marinobacterium weihaiense]